MIYETGTYYKVDEDDMISTGHTGVCEITTSLDLLPLVPNNRKVRKYKRLEVEINSNKELLKLKNTKNYEILAIMITTPEHLDMALSYSDCDVLRFDMSSLTFMLKDGVIRDAITRGYFIEIVLRDYKKDSKSWLKNVLDICRITKGKNLIFTSGATNTCELRPIQDKLLFLEFLGFKKAKAHKILVDNPTDLLYKCAFKRYTSKGVVANNLDVGNLKKDFITSRFDF